MIIEGYNYRWLRRWLEITSRIDTKSQNFKRALNHLHNFSSLRKREVESIKKWNADDFSKNWHLGYF